MRYTKYEANTCVTSRSHRVANEILLFWHVNATSMGSYRRFGTTCMSHIQESSSLTGSFDFVNHEDKTDRLSQNVGKQQFMLLNISEERRSQVSTSYTILPTNTNTTLNNRSRSCTQIMYFRIFKTGLSRYTVLRYKAGKTSCFPLPVHSITTDLSVL